MMGSRRLNLMTFLAVAVDHKGTKTKRDIYIWMSIFWTINALYSFFNTVFPSLRSDLLYG